MNHIYRLVWNQITNTWVCCAENVKGRSKPGSARVAVSRSSWGDVAKNGICKKVFALTSLSAALAFAGVASAANLPTGGNIVAGAGTISQSGNVMTITQGTARMAADWQSFSIGQGSTVNFVQPSASSVALNRVLGADVSVIQGALHANGQVFLINPNGVLFNQTAQVNVGGITASTLNISNADFMAGNYKFAGASSNAIVNQGNITAANGGTIALIAAKITNDGNLTANGGNVLLGAGSKVTLDLGGPVKLLVESAAIDALIHNGGAIKADGGTVMLTSHAAGDLIATVINNTGVIEAQTLATGEKGQIFLLGDMVNDRIVVGGTLDASAPNGGDGGFIETSAAKVSTTADLSVTTRAPNGNTGTWLIDPVTYTIAASGGDETGAALAARLVGTNIQIQADSTVNINDAVSWSANKLTLTSGGNININSTMTATGTGSLALEYGQSSANGAGSTYTVANSAGMYIPVATAFTWKKGSAGNTTNLVFANDNLRFGNGTQASLNSNGLLEQPWYFDNTSVVNGVQRNAWFKLTFSNYALNLEVAAGGVGTSDWNRNGSILGSQTNLAGAITSKSFDVSKFKEGTGTIVSSINLGFGGGETLRIDNTYTLAAGASFVKTVTNMTNTGAATASNLRLWVGTQDDYVATRDSQYKIKGNLTANGFEQIAAQTDQAKALKVTEFNNGTGAAILFYSISSGADTSFASCCSFTNATGINPRSSEIANANATDGSYALFIRLADLAVGQSGGMTWYYAAAPAAQLTAAVTAVAQSSGAAPAPAPAAEPVNNIPLLAAVAHVETGAHHSVSALRGEPARLSATLSQPSVQPSVVNNAPMAIGSLDVVAISSGRGEHSSPVQGAATPMNSDGVANADSGATDSGTADSQIATQISEQRSLSVGTRIFVVDGGINLAVNNEGESR